MATLNLPSFTLGIPMWYLDPPTPLPTPPIVLTPIQPIEMMSQPPPSTKMTAYVSTIVPPRSTKTGGKTPKTTTEPHPPLACDLCNVQGHMT